VTRLYAELRRESEISNGVPIAVRHIESIMRISEALARMRLADVVTDGDVQEAMKMMLRSFIAAQKHAVQKPLERQFMRYLYSTGNDNRLLLEKIKELVQERIGLDAALHGPAVGGDVESVEIRVSDLMDRVRRYGISDVSNFLNKEVLAKANISYDAERKVLIKRL
jgi:DNA replication licensing factor MCM2